tara:strand:+ start:68 stop:244 length:177 start_codon:yes stop_codon:yes gene_type:complete
MINQLVQKVKRYLKKEIKLHEDFTYETTDGTSDILVGRVELAESLLRQMKIWEENEDE